MNIIDKAPQPFALGTIVIISQVSVASVPVGGWTFPHPVEHYSCATGDVRAWIGFQEDEDAVDADLLRAAEAEGDAKPYDEVRKELGLQ